MPTNQNSKVTIVGSGNWGSAIAKIIGRNVRILSEFDPTVTMYVYEEIIDGKKLTEIINEQHENVKYLPGVKLPDNVVAEPDIIKACEGADILVFVLPHQFIPKICCMLKGKIKDTAIGLSLIKGFVTSEEKGIQLVSTLIRNILGIEVAVLMGANIANEVAKEEFCETTIGCKDNNNGLLLKKLVQSENFRVVVVDDCETVEVCGGLKNIVACAAGFADGLGLGDNTKAAIIRLGMMEMINFVNMFYKNGNIKTFFESCGLADLITTCYGGRNRRCSEMFVKSDKSLDDIERETLNGQKLQGPLAAEEVVYMLEQKGVTQSFPLFCAVHKIFKRSIPTTMLIEMLREHPVHQDVRIKSSL